MPTRPAWARAVLLGIALLIPPSTVLAQGFGPPTVTLWATREGLVGQTTANGHVIVERDRFVALPSRKALNALGQRDFVVRLEYRGRSVEAPVWDVGPWNIGDDYWNERRDGFRDLPRWTPQAEAAFFQGHSGGRDGFGRFVTIPTSIDLADGTFWDDLQMTANDWIQVTFLWLDAPSPPPKSTPRVVPKIPPPSAATPPPGAPPPPATASQAALSASPNPVPAGLGRGTTTISWDTGDGSFARVYVWQKGGNETLFAEGEKGSADAPWIQNGYTYEFRLYRGRTRTDRLRTLVVTGNSVRPTPTPPPDPPVGLEPGDSLEGEAGMGSGPLEEFAFEPGYAAGETGTGRATAGSVEAPGPVLAASPSARAGAGGLEGGILGEMTTITWSTGSEAIGQIYVSVAGRDEELFGQGASGSRDIPWMDRGPVHRFELYEGLDRGVALAALVLGTDPEPGG